MREDRYVDREKGIKEARDVKPYADREKGIEDAKYVREQDTMSRVETRRDDEMGRKNAPYNTQHQLVMHQKRYQVPGIYIYNGTQPYKSSTNITLQCTEYKQLWAIVNYTQHFGLYRNISNCWTTYR